MSSAVVLAFVAGVCAVAGAWEALAAVDRAGAVRTLGRWLAPLRRTGGEPTPVERRRLAAVGAGTLCASGWLVAGPEAALALGAAGPLAVSRALALRRRRRRDELARAAPAVARALADALAGGHAVRGAIGAAARGGGLRGPARAELAVAAGALDLGEPTVVVLERLRSRAGDRGWDALVAAILVQSGAGGDLGALLRGLAERLEASRRAAAEARSTTAQARMTAWIVAGLPLGAAVLAELASPGFARALVATPLTTALVVLSGVLQLAAIACVRRIARAPR